MIIYVDDTQQTLPALIAAKQLVLNAAYSEVTVIKFITAAKRIMVVLSTDAKGDIKERWAFEDSSITFPTVSE